ncbi:hypothetical protein [uncultured Cellulomonas sp.]|uniref:hypothetical protein n=1 Tax=uncultured Cellulomonas sp. TaxID=189682 RepID=UPI00261330B1|nr:hypothetical protein [uncultured Cellulomonas sp.]
MMLIVELVTAWCALSLALGLPLARRIRSADAAEFPWRREDPWWAGHERIRPDLQPAPRADLPALV